MDTRLASPKPPETTPSVYRQDEAFSRTVRDRILVPWYRKTLLRHVLIDGDSGLKVDLQLLGLDTLAWRRDGQLLGIDEKILRWAGNPPYKDLCIETRARDGQGNEVDGWMLKPSYYPTHLLNVGCYRPEQQSACPKTCDGTKCHTLRGIILDFPAFYCWFWDALRVDRHAFRDYGPLKNGEQVFGYLVPMQMLYDEPSTPAWPVEYRIGTCQ